MMWFVLSVVSIIAPPGLMADSIAAIVVLILSDNRQKDMNLGKMYVDEFRSNIAEPLRQEVLELRDQIDQLRNAIQKIDACAHRASCPVINELQHQSQDK